MLKSRPIEEKESYKWLTRPESVIETSEFHPTTQFISIGNREADVYDLFLVNRPSNVDLLVRLLNSADLSAEKPMDSRA